MFNIYSILPFSIGTIFLFVGFLIYYKNKKSALNRLFGFECFSAFMWLFSYAAMYACKDSSTAYLWTKFVYTGVVLIPIFFYHFSIELLQINNPVEKKWLKVAYITGSIFLLFLYFTRSFIAGTYKYYWGYYSKAGVFHNFFLIFLFTICSRSFILLYKNYLLTKIISPLKSNQIRYVFWAFSIAFVLGSTDFLPLYGFEYYPIGSIFIAIGLATIAYTILRYRLMNINIVISRAGIFTFVYTLVLAIPFIIGGIIRPHLYNVITNWWIIPVMVGVILASAGPFIYMRLQKRFEAKLRAQEFKSHEALRRLSHNMLRFTNLNVLLSLMVHYLVKVLKLKFAAIYLLDSQSGKYLLSSTWHSGENIEPAHEFEENSYLAEYLLLKKIPIVTEELSHYAHTKSSFRIKELSAVLSGLKINTVIPCFLRNALMGFLILSDRKGNIPFTQDDLNLLMVLSNEAALAIENAKFHQKEVSQLVEKSKREALADMAPGASHQFNNRLASISSSVELLLFKMEKLNIEAHQDENTKVFLKDAKMALELIDNEVYKGKEITSAILKRAKAKVEFQEFNLVSLIENTYKLVMISCSRSGLDKARELKFNIVSSSKALNIFASEALLQDVFYNLIDNAYDAIQDKAALNSHGNSLFQGEIEVTLKQEDNVIVVHVRDNGIGLTKENHRKLFTPYFTTKATSNKGSGLGLCVIRDFIEMHKGTITCDSEYGKGAAFTIKLPIKKEK